VSHTYSESVSHIHSEYIYSESVRHIYIAIFFRSAGEGADRYRTHSVSHIYSEYICSESVSHIYNALIYIVRFFLQHEQSRRI